MPARLGRYVVQRRIGAGGFATVWLAYDEQLDSPVAVKVLADNWTEDAHIRRRFAEEGRYLRRVESPHVVTVYDAGELDDGRPYLVMTYADQGTLADRLELGAFTHAQSLEVVRQVAAGLQALHDRDVLHRDVKPANVLFRTVGGELRAMLGDLGLGKALDMSSRLTMIAGTPAYVAPEQAAAEPIDARADQYSLAALTYLLLAGRPPFEFADLKAAATPGEVPPLAGPDSSCPPEAEAVVRRGLSVDREDRFGSVTEYAAALAEALDVDATPAGRGPWLTPQSDITQVAAPATTVSLRPSASSGSSDPTVGTTGILNGALNGTLNGTATGPPQVGSEVAPEVRRRPRRRVLAVIAALALLAGVVSGGVAFALRRHHDENATRTHRDATGPHWTQLAQPGAGVFAGLLPGTLPTHVPRHPDCTTAVGGQQFSRVSAAGSYLREAFSGCGSGGVIVEQVQQVAAGQLLWIQVRDDDPADAYAVLNSVSTPGV
jgi:eukaryotic-like serine/threonine-protein kinase